MFHTERPANNTIFIFADEMTIGRSIFVYYRVLVPIYELGSRTNDKQIGQ